MDDEREAIRTELYPDDPTVQAALDLVRCELELLPPGKSISSRAEAVRPSPYGVRRWVRFPSWRSSFEVDGRLPVPCP
jgi:hypothetical protein